MGKEKKELQEEIEEKGAKWRAEETSMSELSPEEQMRRLGLNPTEEEKRELKKKGHVKKETRSL